MMMNLQKTEQIKCCGHKTFLIHKDTESLHTVKVWKQLVSVSIWMTFMLAWPLGVVMFVWFFHWSCPGSRACTRSSQKDVPLSVSHTMATQMKRCSWKTCLHALNLLSGNNLGSQSATTATEREHFSVTPLWHFHYCKINEKKCILPHVFIFLLATQPWLLCAGAHLPFI